jgi:phage gpG-like protein
VIDAVLVGDRRLIGQLQALPQAVQSGLGRAMLQLAQQLQDHVQQDKLSGEVLRVRSGALRASIAAQTADSGTTFSATVGSDLPYAAAQEYGFSGTVSVRAHLRRIREAFGRPIAERTISVGAYTRNMNLPARSFLGSALADMQPEIEAALRDAVNQPLEA